MTDDLDFDLQLLAGNVRRFVQERVVPQLPAWEEAGEFPRSLYREAADLGLLGLGYPEEVGGMPAPYAVRNALLVAMSRWGASGGVLAGLFSHNIALAPVLRHGTHALQQEVIPPVLRGEQVAALAITEPGGWDVANLRTRARREGDVYVIDGDKTFIASGLRADWITVAVRTAGGGAGGISLIVVPGDTPGLTRTRLHKMGWHASDTAQLHFDGVRVPARYVVGDEGDGFRIVMSNFNGERLAMSAMALGLAQACYDEAVGGAPVEKQVVRHKLVDMQTRILSTEAWLNAVTGLADEGKLESDPDCGAQVCMLRNHGMQTLQFCADAAVQLLEGMGTTKSERSYREVKVMMEVGGTEEIMKDLAARQLGL